MVKFGNARATFPMDHLRSGPDKKRPGRNERMFVYVCPGEHEQMFAFIIILLCNKYQ